MHRFPSALAPTVPIASADEDKRPRLPVRPATCGGNCERTTRLVMHGAVHERNFDWISNLHWQKGGVSARSGYGSTMVT